MTQFDPFFAAEARFRWITNQRATGQMDEATFRAEMNALRVQDAQGRWWMLQEGTGNWFMWQGNQWVAGSPHPAVQAPAPPPPAPAPAQPRSTKEKRAAHLAAVQGPATAPAPSVGSAMFKSLIMVVVIFGVIGLGLWIFVEDARTPGLFLGLGLAALISWLITLKQVSDAWEGQVVDLREERVSSGDDDWSDELFAYIRQPNGKTKKIKADHSWRVGDHLQKRKGENWIRKLN